MKPVAIDLFCGRGGWANGLIEAGFTVYGFDIEPQPDFKGIFIQADILTITADDLRAYMPSFATCSSPCEQFSVHGMKHFHPNPKFPEMGIRLFNHARALLEELGVPYVMENVRPAEKFVGKAVNHCGPFYLWGPGVPAMFSPEAFKVSKGISWGSSVEIRGMTAIEKRVYRSQGEMYNRSWSSSDKRKQDVAAAAMIPLPISRAVAQVAIHSLLEV